MAKDTEDSIISLTKQLSSIYENNSTLNYLKRFEEDRKSLLDLTSSSWQEPTMQEKMTDMASALSASAIQAAFKTHADYELYANPILSSIHANNYNSLQEAITKATEPWLNNNYMQAIKATDLFSDTIKSIADMGVLHDITPYGAKLSEAMLLFKDQENMLNASKNLVGLASLIENDAFKTKFESPLEEASGKIAKTMSELQISIKSESPILKVSEALKVFNKPLGAINPPDFPKIKFDLPQIELPKIENSPIYKQNEKLINKSDKQVILLKDMSKYMASQTEKLEFQNKITSQQIEANHSSAKVAFWTAVTSIAVAVIFSIAGIILTYYVFQEEDKSDNKNHTELLKSIEANNNNKNLAELTLQIKEENKNIILTNKMLNEQNEYFKELLKAKK